MKSPENYLREQNLISKDKSIEEPFALQLSRDGHVDSLKKIIEIIERAQKDAWNEAFEGAICKI